jgi:hypothetical protein
MKKFHTMLIPASFWILLMVDCTGGGIKAPSMTPAGKETAATVTPTQKVASLQLTASMIGTAVPSSTETPEVFQIKDWREPAEVITAENMNRVERIGRIDYHVRIIMVAWSADGSMMGISVGLVVYIVDPVSYEKKVTMDGEYYIAFSPDGKILQNGGRRFDTTTGEEFTEGGGFSAWKGSWADVAYSPDGEYYVICGTSTCLIGYRKPEIPVSPFGRTYLEQSHVSISPDSGFITVNYTFEDYTELWDPYRVRPIRKLQLQGITAKGKPRFSADGKTLFVTGQGTWDNAPASFLQEWDFSAGRPLDVQLLPETVVDWGRSMDVSPMSDVIAYGGKGGGVYVMKNRDCHAVKVGESANGSYIDQVVFRPDGMMFATIEYDNRGLELWGVPAEDQQTPVKTPTVQADETPSSCPKIPMIAENTTPDDGWSGFALPTLTQKPN